MIPRARIRLFPEKHEVRRDPNVLRRGRINAAIPTRDNLPQTRA